MAERLTLMAVRRASEPSLEWAQSRLAHSPHGAATAIAHELRRQSAAVARIDGAVAGTPFFVALIPGYLAFLWQEAVMVLRTAALFGRDPRRLAAAAEILVLCGVHRTVEAATAAVERVAESAPPERPQSRRSLRIWISSARRVLVLGGFLSPPRDAREPAPHGVAVRATLIVLGVAIWALTWIFPVTFMVVMAWGCERNMRTLGGRALERYGGPGAATKRATAPEQGSLGRRRLRALAVALSVAIPIAFIAFADHLRHKTGFNALEAAGALVALSVVIATMTWARRR